MEILDLPNNEAIKSSSSMRGTLLKMSPHRHFIYSCVHFSVRVRDPSEGARRTPGPTPSPEQGQRLLRGRTLTSGGEGGRMRGGACWTSTDGSRVGLPTFSIGRTDRSTGTGRGYLQVWNSSMFQDVRRICDRTPRPGGCSGSSCSVLPSGAARTDGSLCVRDETDLSRPCSLGQWSR